MHIDKPPGSLLASFEAREAQRLIYAVRKPDRLEFFILRSCF
jgi:hypothetical protein